MTYSIVNSITTIPFFLKSMMQFSVVSIKRNDVLVVDVRVQGLSSTCAYSLNLMAHFDLSVWIDSGLSANSMSVLHQMDGIQSYLVNPCFFNPYASQSEHTSW